MGTLPQRGPTRGHQRGHRREAWAWFGSFRSRQGVATAGPELEANVLAPRTAALCGAQHRAGGFWSLENPETSLVWGYGPIGSLLELGADVSFDQCRYGLRTDPELNAGYVRKATRIRSNLPALQALGLRCTRDHTHQRCGGKVRTPSGWMNRSALAGRYPDALCMHWAALVASSSGALGR